MATNDDDVRSPYPAAARLLSSSLSEFTFVSDNTKGHFDASFSLLAHAGAAFRAGRACVLITCYGDAAHWRAALRRLLGAEDAAAIAVVNLCELFPKKIISSETFSEMSTAMMRARALIDGALAAAATENASYLYVSSTVASSSSSASASALASAPTSSWIGIDDIFGIVDAWGLAFGSATILALPAAAAEKSVYLTARAAPGINWSVDTGAGDLLGVGLRAAVEDAATGTIFVETLVMAGERGAQGRLRWSRKKGGPGGVAVSEEALFRVAIDGRVVDGV